MHNFPSVFALATGIKPLAPIHCFRKSAVRKAVQWFTHSFPGKVLYAVKTNPDPVVLSHVYQSGIRNFDVASLAEIELVANLLPESNMYFMHTVKPRESIAEAYHRYGIRDFALDSEQELQKILEATGFAKDLRLHVRLGIPNQHAAHDLSGKFGIAPAEAPALLRRVKMVARAVGMSFHVGSQCMHPASYTLALNLVKQVVRRANIRLDVLDVGGGFPSVYPGMTPPPLESYMQEIIKMLPEMPLKKGAEIWCEPGRALVAESGSVLVRVDLRKGQSLYINDGTYGSLFDAGVPGMVFPTRLIRAGGITTHEVLPYQFYGPTCDSMDHMKGPFYLPADIREGDYIEIGQLGAYGSTLRTKFNGFYSDELVEVEDAPMLSMYGLTEEEGFQEQIVA